MKNDQELKLDLLSQLKNRLELEPELKPNNIEVLVRNGLVTLRGWVPCYTDKLTILNTVKGERGIMAWTDDIVVKVPAEHSRTEGELAESARDAINTITTIPASSIKITVEGGWLTFEGTVEHTYQKEVAEYAVNGLAGLMGITNLITVKQK